MKESKRGLASRFPRRKYYISGIAGNRDYDRLRHNFTKTKILVKTSLRLRGIVC